MREKVPLVARLSTLLVGVLFFFFSTSTQRASEIIVPNSRRLCAKRAFHERANTHTHTLERHERNRRVGNSPTRLGVETDSERTPTTVQRRH